MSFSEALNRFRLPTMEEMKERMKAWFEQNGSTWAISTIVHVVLLLAAMIILSKVIQERKVEAPQIDSVAQQEDLDIPRFELEKPQYDTSELNDETLQKFKDEPVAQTEQHNDDNPIFEERGGGTTTGVATGGGLGFDIKAAGLGPVLKGGGGIESGLGEGTHAGKGGAGDGFGLRGSGSREAIPGVTRASERAVAAALNWIARHQSDDHWTMDHGHGTKCKDKSCTGPALAKSDSGATALALLPFLAAGQTHEKGFYRDQIGKGIIWLVKHQNGSGDLSAGSDHQMYSHGLAAIALCEAYGMTQDSKLVLPAQNAVKFIETAMNGAGGWRYTPGSGDSDLSVFGWELMALKSADMAGLKVDPATFEKARGYLGTASTGRGGFSYMTGGGPKNSMTGIGVLASQYLGAKKDDPAIKDGVQYLINAIPVPQEYDTYYWYYATQAMHNVPGPEWEKWNRAMRKLLIDSQTKSGCATGSWNPDPDNWGAQGGRLMVTSLSCLTLEVYYRYTPLFKLDKEEPDKAVGAMPAEKPADKDK